MTACQTTRRTLNFDTSVELVIDVQNRVNPDRDNRSSPVVVRVFALADDRQFAREDFLSLYENAESRLGKDLINTVVLKEFAPGEQRIEKLELTPETKYIGLLAEFAQYQRAESLILLAITDHKKNKYGITLGDTQIGLTNARLARKLSTSSDNRPSPKRDATVTIPAEEYERLRKN
ncbi:MAG: type VI secretion system lipoprotein TssJ [Gammaproteobacteria bacterium]|nr:type VI secretion system lipoprotein TssJ [Gammaproteobacteria bacterium]